MSSSFRDPLRAACVAAVAGCTVAVTAASPLYRITEIGFLPGGYRTSASDMNDDAVIVGTADQPFVWTPQAGIQPAPLLPDGRTFPPEYLNAAGDMVGAIYDFGYFRYEEYLRRADGSYEQILQDTLAGGDNFGWNLQLTDTRQVLGQSGVTLSTQPWLWSETTGVHTDLRIGNDQNSFYAKRINAKGQIAGYYEFSSKSCYYEERAFLYDTVTHHLEWLDHGPKHQRASPEHCGHYSAANDVNSSGQVVGYGNTFATEFGQPYRAFIWTKETGLQPIPGDAEPHNMVDMRAQRINESGQVVGTFRYADQNKHGFFYWDKESGAIDLQKLLDPADSLTPEVVLKAEVADLEFALNDHRPLLNNRGQIVVEGTRRSDTRYGTWQDTRRAFLLTPVGH